MRNSFIFGAPIRSTERLAFEDTLLLRFRDDPERAVEYINKVLDRQINKARGILTTTSILAGAALVTDNLFAFILSLCSLFLLLGAFYVRWSHAKRYSDPVQDFRSTSEICYRRSFFMTAAIIATCVSMSLLLVQFF